MPWRTPKVTPKEYQKTERKALEKLVGGVNNNLRFVPAVVVSKPLDATERTYCSVLGPQPNCFYLVREQEEGEKNTKDERGKNTKGKKNSNSNISDESCCSSSTTNRSKWLDGKEPWQLFHRWGDKCQFL